jgi:hypothetical protein
VGGVLLGAMFLLTMAPQLLLIGLMAVTHNLRKGESPADASMPAATAGEQSAWAFRYFALCFFLGACIYLSRRLLA